MENNPMGSKDGREDELMVFIVGAGIGGLILGALLQRAKIQYHIFEKAKEIKPLGKAIKADFFLSNTKCPLSLILN